MSRQITVLNIAEKNSVAREVSRLLSGGNMREEQSCAPYCKVFSFPFQLQGSQVNMVFSSVMGHLLELDFAQPYTSWNRCSPLDLYSAPVSKQVKGHNDKVERNLQQQARRAQKLVLWLDCDREGENIAFEVIQVCTQANPRLAVQRARFSALIQRDLLHAVNNLVPPNANEAAAVDVRQEIDLRIGSSFTRLQTMLLQDKFEWGPYIEEGRERMLISYGPCQFPTLGLIVQREWEIQAHIPEDFWNIVVYYRSSSNQSCDFKWRRGRLFDQAVAEMYHRLCLNAPTATVTSVDGRQKSRWAPAPLSTLEMQKKASQSLRISGERIMKLAEELYQAGFISYPRTETDVFAPNMDLQTLIAAQANAGAPWSSFAQRLQDGEFRWPRDGGHDDKAHPPIHPVKPYNGEGGDKARLYEFIVRSFLACCAHDAQGQETTVVIDITEETFSTTGLMVTARNWLDVYPYTNWGGQEALPHFTVGQTFQPVNIDLHRGTTQPPPRMKESDLLAKMDEFGIGTDATIADHIAKQLARGYATKDEATLTFAPTQLGEALISAYRKMGLTNLWVPTLRGTIERNIAEVARGSRPKDEVLQEALQYFKADFVSAQARAGILEEEVRQIVFQGAAPQAPNNINGGGGGGEPFATCTCGGTIRLSPAAAGGQPAIVMCSAHPICRLKKVLPRCTQSVTISDQLCTACTHGQVKKLQLTFNRPLLPPTFQHMAQSVSCIVCNTQLAALLDLVGAPPAVRRLHQVQRGGVQAHARGGARARGSGSGTGSRGGRRRSSQGNGSNSQQQRAPRGGGRGTSSARGRGSRGGSGGRGGRSNRGR